MVDQVKLEKAAEEVLEVHTHLLGLAVRLGEYENASSQLKAVSSVMGKVAATLKDSYEALSVFIQETRTLKQKSVDMQKVQAGILAEIPMLLKHLQSSGVPKALDGFHKEISSLSQKIEIQGKALAEVQKGIGIFQPRLNHVESTLGDRIRAVEALVTSGTATIEKSTDSSKELLSEVIKTLAGMRRDIQDLKAQSNENAGKLHILSNRRGFTW